jgi:formylglycine-generating enzyme required for sulfatase activity
VVIAIGAVATYLAIKGNKTPSGGAAVDPSRKEEPKQVTKVDPEKVDPKPVQDPKVPVPVDPPKMEDQLTFDLGNSIKLELIKINARGKKFFMGSPKNEPDRTRPSSLPGLDFDPEEQHEVTFKRDWYMGKYEVTQEQYEAIVGSNPSLYKGAKRPVEYLSWDDAQAFIKKLNEKFKDRKIKFRLPSEAEWEYACRAGTTTAYYFGKTITTQQAHFGDNTTKVASKPVGTFEPNAFGLYDMHGNAREWCEDFYGAYSKAPTDGSAQKVKPAVQTSDVRVLRGGNWADDARDCRSAWRIGVTQVLGRAGFRVACDPD